MRITSSKLKDDKIGQIFESNHCGKCIIIGRCKDETKIARYYVKFLDTGGISISQFKNIEKGTIMDPLAKTNCGVGYLGENFSKYRKEDIDLYLSLKTRWHSMIARCYNEKSVRYCNYGGVGVTVHDRWHNFCNYYEDVQKLDGYDRDQVLSGYLELDKDLLQENIDTCKKVYSKETCIWLPNTVNGKLGKILKPIKLTHPDGSATIEESVQMCLKKYNLEPARFYRVLHGKKNDCFGYKPQYYNE